MEQLLKLATDSGMSESQGKDSLGGIFSFLKSKMSEGDFSKISQAVPEAGQLASDADAKIQGGGGGGGGLMGSAMGMLGGGGGGASGGGIDGLGDLMGFFGKQGVNPQQATGLMGNLSGFLKDNAGVDPSSVLGTGGSGASSGAEGLASQAQGLLGAFGK